STVLPYTTLFRSSDGNSFAARIGGADPASRAAHYTMQAAGHFQCADVVSHRLQGHVPVHRGTGLQFGRAVTAAEMRQVEGRLQVIPLVQYKPDAARHIVDDRAATRRAKCAIE